MHRLLPVVLISVASAAETPPDGLVPRQTHEALEIDAADLVEGAYADLLAASQIR